jgi:TolB-like protein/ketosteroid isomerase-like protein
VRGAHPRCTPERRFARKPDVPGPQDETYARRLTVVLIAVLASEEAGEQASLERAGMSVVDALRRAGGDAEAATLGRIVGTFDTPAHAVEAGLQARARISADARLSGVGIHIGVDTAEIVASSEGRALRDAVAAAEWLAARAPEGTICVPLTIAQAVEGTPRIRVRDLGVPAPGEPHVYLIVAGEAGSRWPRRKMIGGLAAVVVVAAVTLAVLRRRLLPPPAEIALGVMPFKSVTDDAVHAGLRAAMRDGLNTQLSLLEGVKVYSREFLDFLVTREGLSEYEAASRLGIRKVLSGTVNARGADVRVEVQIVDIATGTLDSSFVVVGSDNALIELESDVAHAVIEKLGVELTGADTRRLESFRATDVGAYRRFLATEGENPAPEPSGGPSSWLLPRSAWAEDAGRDEVLAFLERYRKAIEAGDLSTLAGLYVQFPAEQRTALEHYYKDSTDLRVKLEDIDVAIAGDEAIVSYTRKDDFVDSPTGRPMHVSGRVTKLLKRSGGKWQLAPGR